ncbi:MAG TPA: hypothetical protein VJT31_18280, partial [Rugosimonospora sp.]|nr:hypothetical protein [Rugosimonospora sp.]
MSTLGIAIVNFRSAGDTAELVRSVVDRAGDPVPRVALAIVDNSDQAEELRRVVARAAGRGVVATLIHGQGNIGYAAGNNLAAAWLLDQGADVLWVLNPDTRITGGA